MNSTRLSAIMILAASALHYAPATAEVPAPAFTMVQTEAGARDYADHCTQCHGAELEGKNGPALKGVWFVDEWSSSNRTIDDLRNYLKLNMPLGSPGSLSDTQYMDLTAFLLRENDYKPGPVPMDASNLQQRLYLPDVLNAADLPARSPRGSFPIGSVNIAKASTARPDDGEILKPSDGDWLMYNHTLSATRYSSLDQINRDNVAHLGATCMFQLGELGAFEAAPVVYDGVMYITSPYNTYALNPATCRKCGSTSSQRRRPVPHRSAAALPSTRARCSDWRFNVIPQGKEVGADRLAGRLRKRRRILLDELYAGAGKRSSLCFNRKPGT